MIVPTVKLIAGGALYGPPAKYVYPFHEQQPELCELATTTVVLFCVCLLGQAVRHALYYHWHERLWDFLNSPVIDTDKGT